MPQLQVRFLPHFFVLVLLLHTEESSLPKTVQTTIRNILNNTISCLLFTVQVPNKIHCTEKWIFVPHFSYTDAFKTLQTNPDEEHLPLNLWNRYLEKHPSLARLRQGFHLHVQLLPELELIHPKNQLYSDILQFP